MMIMLLVNSWSYFLFNFVLEIFIVMTRQERFWIFFNSLFIWIFLLWLCWILWFGLRFRLWFSLRFRLSDFNWLWSNDVSGFVINELCFAIWCRVKWLAFILPFFIFIFDIRRISSVLGQLLFSPSLIRCGIDTTHSIQ